MENIAKDLEKIKILITIVNRGKGHFFIDSLENFDVNLQCLILGRGTANSELLDILGLDSAEKDIILSTVREDEVKQIIDKLNEKFNQKKSLNGICFTVPVKSVVGVYLYQFLSNTRTKRSN